MATRKWIRYVSHKSPELKLGVSRRKFGHLPFGRSRQGEARSPSAPWAAASAASRWLLSWSVAT